MTERKRKPGGGAKPKADRTEIVVRDKPFSVYPKKKYLEIWDNSDMITICKSALEAEYEKKLKNN